MNTGNKIQTLSISHSTGTAWHNASIASLTCSGSAAHASIIVPIRASSRSSVSCDCSQSAAILAGHLRNSMLLLLVALSRTRVRFPPPPLGPICDRVASWPFSCDCAKNLALLCFVPYIQWPIWWPIRMTQVANYGIWQQTQGGQRGQISYAHHSPPQAAYRRWQRAASDDRREAIPTTSRC